MILLMLMSTSLLTLPLYFPNSLFSNIDNAIFLYKLMATMSSHFDKQPYIRASNLIVLVESEIKHKILYKNIEKRDLEAIF